MKYYTFKEYEGVYIMKIKEICEQLGVTRKGLYWMLTHNDLGEHAKRKPSGRWIIDDTAVEMLRDIRKKSKKVIVEVAPADPHAAETIRGMQLEINRLTKQLKIITLKFRQGIYLRNDINDIADESKTLDDNTKRRIKRLVDAFDKETSDSSVKKQLDAAKRQDEDILESLGQTKLL